jgi:hypothetical protein
MAPTIKGSRFGIEPSFKKLVSAEDRSKDIGSRAGIKQIGSHKDTVWDEAFFDNYWLLIQ